MIDYYNFVTTYLVLSRNQHHHTVLMRNLRTQGITGATPHSIYHEAKNTTENIQQISMVANEKLWVLQYFFSKSRLKVVSG